MSESPAQDVRGAEAGSPAFAVCSSCGARLTAHAWRELPLAETLTPAKLAAFVQTWPAATTIEVRRCTCGRALARRIRA
jgi:hypothetical protein